MKPMTVKEHNQSYLSICLHINYTFQIWNVHDLCKLCISIYYYNLFNFFFNSDNEGFVGGGNFSTLSSLLFLFLFSSLMLVLETMEVAYSVVCLIASSLNFSLFSKSNLAASSFNADSGLGSAKRHLIVYK